MFRPDFSSRPFAGAPSFDRAPARPSTGEFSSLMSEVRSEVRDFIEHGSSDPGPGVAGRALRQWRQATAPEASGSPRPEAGNLRSEAAGSLRPEAAARILGLGRLARSGDAGGSVASVDAKLTLSSARPDQQAFLAAIRPWAEEAAKRLGVAPEIVAAQAALESGWGKYPVRREGGRDTHNLFGIKAGASWRGRVAEVATKEFENGVAVGRTEKFRSYPDPASAFRDFARLLLDNPRYHAALNTGDDAHAYASALVRGGYATDPAYADKLVRIATRLQRPD